MFVDSFLLVGEQFTASSTRTAFSNTNRSFDLKFFKKLLFVSACIVFAAICFTGSATAQGRDRVVKPTASQPTNRSLVSNGKLQFKYRQNAIDTKGSHGKDRHICLSRKRGRSSRLVYLGEKKARINLELS